MYELSSFSSSLPAVSVLTIFYFTHVDRYDIIILMCIPLIANDGEYISCIYLLCLLCISLYILYLYMYSCVYIICVIYIYEIYSLYILYLNTSKKKYPLKEENILGPGGDFVSMNTTNSATYQLCNIGQVSYQCVIEMLYLIYSQIKSI